MLDFGKGAALMGAGHGAVLSFPLKPKSYGGIDVTPQN